MSLPRGNESLDFSGMDVADLQDTPHRTSLMNPSITREMEAAGYSSRLSTPGGGSYDNTTYPGQRQNNVQGQMGSVMNHLSNPNQNQSQNQIQSQSLASQFEQNHHPSSGDESNQLGRQKSLRPQGNTHNNIFGEPPASPNMKKEYKMSSDIFCTGRIIDESGQHFRRAGSGTRIQNQNSSTVTSPHVGVDSYHRDAVRTQYSNSNEKIIGPTSASSHQLLSHLQSEQQRQPITASVSFDGNMGFNKNFNNNNERGVGESRSSESVISSTSHSNMNSGMDYTPDRKPNARENGFNPVTGIGYTEVELPKSQRRHFEDRQRSTPLW